MPHWTDTTTHCPAPRGMLRKGEVWTSPLGKDDRGACGCLLRFDLCCLAAVQKPAGQLRAVVGPLWGFCFPMGSAGRKVSKTQPTDLVVTAMCAYLSPFICMSQAGRVRCPSPRPVDLGPESASSAWVILLEDLLLLGWRHENQDDPAWASDSSLR